MRRHFGLERAGRRVVELVAKGDARRRLACRGEVGRRVRLGAGRAPYLVARDAVREADEPA